MAIGPFATPDMIGKEGYFHVGITSEPDNIGVNVAGSLSHAGLLE
jgi:hypothetical protein